MYKRFNDALDQTPSLSNLVRMPRVGKRVGVRKKQTPICLLMIPSTTETSSSHQGDDEVAMALDQEVKLSEQEVLRQCGRDY